MSRILSVLIFAIFAIGFSVQDEQLHEKYHLAWADNNDEITLTAHITDWEGWAGFGIGENGMTNADIVIFAIKANEGAQPTLFIQDCFATGMAKPGQDPANSRNDWTMTATITGTMKEFVLKRKLVVADTTNDRNFVEGPMNIIWAFGTMNADFTDFNQHATGNMGRKSITFMEPSTATPPTTTTIRPTTAGGAFTSAATALIFASIIGAFIFN